jgi:hypothetical protein
MKRHADMGEAIHTKPEAGRTERRCGNATAYPTGRIAAIGGEARGSAHGGYGEA